LAEDIQVTSTVAVDGSVRPGGALAARAWLTWSLAAVAIALAGTNPIYRGIVALAALNVLAAWLPRGRSLRPLAWALAFAAGFAIAINLLASHTGEHVLVRFPDGLPLVGGPITVESLAYGATLGLGLVAAVLAVAPLSMVLESHDIVDALPGALERTGIAVAASMNLVSGFGRTFSAVRDAQRMRGWRPGGIRSWNEVLVPVALTAIEDSVLLAEAMEARAFGAGRRSSFASGSLGRRDWLVAGSALLAVGVFVGGRFLGLGADWYPYPSLVMPAVDLPLVAGCLLLALPAFMHRPEPAG